MPIPKLTSRYATNTRPSSAPMTETRIYLELYRLSNEKRRIESEMRDLSARLTGLEQKLTALDSRRRELEVVLGKQSTKADTDHAGRFVLEY